MPRPPRKCSELGSIVNYQGEHRAEIYLGSDKHIRGPRRGTDEKCAFGDLLVIRAAVADHTARSSALQAMKRETEREADRLKEDAQCEIGCDITILGGYRARVNTTTVAALDRRSMALAATAHVARRQTSTPCARVELISQHAQNT